MTEKKDLKNRKVQIAVYGGMFIISAIFYLIWYWHDGIILTEDAPSYINMQSDREPGYCSFLWILRFFFGGDIYLHVAVILQCLLAALAACNLTFSLQKRFKFHWFWMICILFIQYGMTILNRFIAQRRYSYYNSIETEGLAYSLWIFFFLSILGILYDKNRKSIIAAIIWSIVLISIRKQMMITLILIFFCIFAMRLCEKRKWYKGLLEAIVIVVIIMFGTNLVDCTYNFATRGVFSKHTGDSSFILGTELYLTDISKAELIEDEDNREIFLEIMKRADDNQYNIAYAGSGWHNIEDHYSNSYDRIKFDIVNVVVREYQDEKGIPQELRDDNYQKIAGALMKELLPSCIPNLIKLFFCNVIHGLITTVLKVHPVLNWMALFIYVAYILLFVWLVGRKSYQKVSVSALPFAAVTILAILSNVGLTSMTIYCQMRYMLYNTALFYQAGLLMLLEMWNVIRKKD